MPRDIELKHAVINVKNDDNKCFRWAVLSAIHPSKKHSYSVKNYVKWAYELNFKNISFPVKLRDIKKFESQNNTSECIWFEKKF